ncbi:MAG TPA: PspA/IM30 family protein [Burkholderiaceae bacterium]|jgi:phage shock protein A
MHFLDSLTRTIKGVLNDSADAMADPARDARQIVRDLDDSIAKAESALTDIRAQLTVLQSKHDHEVMEANRYGQGAANAVKAGDDALATEALGAQMDHETKAKAYDTQIAQLKPTVTDLDKQIDDMRRRRTDLKSRTEVIEVQAQVANAKDVAATALGGIGGKNLTEDFNRLEEKAQLTSARADARLNSVDMASGKALDDRLNNLNPTGDSPEARLAALKAKMQTQ